MKTTRDIIEVEQAIINLTRAIGGESQDAAVGPDFEKWWVVAVGDAFDEALGDFSLAYADQTARDHAVLVEAVNSGRLQALIEEE